MSNIEERIVLTPAFNKLQIGTACKELLRRQYRYFLYVAGFDAKHEFFMRWEYLLPNPRTDDYTEGELAEFINFDRYDVLLPIGRAHHPHLHLLRLNPSIGRNSLTLFLLDTYHSSWFTEVSDARYGFLVVADRYQNHGCDFYVASYYHFSYLVGRDYERARFFMQQRLGS